MFVKQRTKDGRGKEGFVCGDLKTRESTLVERAIVLKQMLEEATMENRIEDAGTYVEQLKTIRNELETNTKDYGKLCASKPESRKVMEELDELLDKVGKQRQQQNRILTEFKD